MLKVERILAAGEWQDIASDAITLDYEDRCRRRRVMTADGGTQFLLDLPRPVTLADGDGLALDDGRVVGVRAASEPLVEIKAASGQELVKLAWHIGNRHVPLQVLPDGALRIRRDHVIMAMVERLGAQLDLVTAAFAPEAGAYAKHGAHDHAHES